MPNNPYRWLFSFVVGLIILFLCTLAIGDDGKVDYSQYEKDVLVILAENQASTIQKLEAEKHELAKKLELAIADNEVITQKLELAKDDAVVARAEANYYLSFVQKSPEATELMRVSRAETDAENERAEAIDKAIEENRIMVGMTLDQAELAMSGVCDIRSLVEQGNDYEIYAWDRYQDKTITKSIDGSLRKGSVYTTTRPVLIAVYYAEVRDGLVNRTWKEFR